MEYPDEDLHLIDIPANFYVVLSLSPKLQLLP